MQSWKNAVARTCTTRKKEDENRKAFQSKQIELRIQIRAPIDSLNSLNGIEHVARGIIIYGSSPSCPFSVSVAPIHTLLLPLNVWSLFRAACMCLVKTDERKKIFNVPKST